MGYPVSRKGDLVAWVNLFPERGIGFLNGTRFFCKGDPVFAILIKKKGTLFPVWGSLFPEKKVFFKIGPPFGKQGKANFQLIYTEWKSFVLEYFISSAFNVFERSCKKRRISLVYPVKCRQKGTLPLSIFHSMSNVSTFMQNFLLVCLVLFEFAHMQ